MPRSGLTGLRGAPMLAWFRHRDAAMKPLLLLLLLAPSAHAVAPPTPYDIARCEVWARELSFAQSVADRDAAAFASHLHPFAVFGVTRAQPLSGDRAIAEAWKGIVDGSATELRWYRTGSTPVAMPVSSPPVARRCTATWRPGPTGSAASARSGSVAGMACGGWCSMMAWSRSRPTQRRSRRSTPVASPPVHRADAGLKRGDAAGPEAQGAAYSPCMHRRTSLPLLLSFALALAAHGAAHAQSVQPNRYGPPPPPKVGDSAYQRQQQEANEVLQENQRQAARRAAQDQYATALDANRKRLEADRARTDRQRAAAASPAESERLRQDFEQRRQAYEREREELERQQAQSRSRP